MSRLITEKLFPSATNYTDEMYFGMEPAYKSESFGYAGGVTYKFNHGEADVVNGEVYICNVTIGGKYQIMIIGDDLKLLESETFKKLLHINIKENIIESSNKYFSLNELRQIISIAPREVYIMKLIKSRIKEILDLGCTNYKKQYGYSPDCLKDYYVEFVD